MNNIRLLGAVKEKPVVAFVLAVAMFFVTPIIQTFYTSLAFEIWFRDLYQKPLNSALYVVFSILFGMYVSLYLHSRSKCIDCKKNTSKSGFGGSMLGFMIGVCPACFSFIGFLVPLSTSILLTTYSPILLSISIAIIIFSIYKLGGFKKQAADLSSKAVADTSKN